MKREFLQGLGLEKDAIDKIMAENGNDVNAAKADAEKKDTEIQTLRTQLTDANKQIEGFKGMDVSAIQKAAEEYKAKFEQAEKDAADKIAKLEFAHALEGALTGAKARNAKAVRALLDEEKLAFKNGKIEGFEEQIKGVREANPYLFDDEGGKPAPKIVVPGKAPTSGVRYTPDQIAKMSPAEINQNWEAVSASMAEK